MLLRNILLKIFGPRDNNLSLQPNTDQLSKKIDYHFKDKIILIQALKHRSYLVTTGEERLQSNERLELLGDAILGMIVTEFLYKRFPEEEEGILTNYKSILVNRSNLGRVAKKFGLGEFLLLNEAEEKSGGRKRISILSDAVESIIGAIYLDGGLESACKFVYKNITDGLDSLLAEGKLKNYKSQLLEFCQRDSIHGPKYIVEKEYGPDHKKVFTVAVVVNGDKLGYGRGHSKKVAEQRAAKEALIRLQVI